MAGHSRPKDGVLSHAYVPAIHVLDLATWILQLGSCNVAKTWMPATSAGMTNETYSAASAAPPCAFDQPAGSPMNFSTSANIFASNFPLALATDSTSFQVVSACSVTPRSPRIFLPCG